jgi:hypothetical protein
MFQKLESFTQQVSDLADKPSLNPTELKAMFDAAPDEVRVYLNQLIDALKLTTAGDSGAKNIGVTSISGLDGTNIQTVIESIVTWMKTPLAWTDVTFLNTFTDYTADVAYPRTSYSKDIRDIVRLRGIVKANSFGNGNAMFSLPAAHRPAHIRNFICAAYHTTHGNGTAIVEVHLNGLVTTKATLWNGNFGAAPTWVDLGNISFPTN